MRRLLLTAAIVMVGATAAQPVVAQARFGPQAAMVTGLEELQAGDTNGTMGIGGRIIVSPPIPMLSIGIVGQGVYYFPEDGSYMTYGLGGRLGLGLPMITPYVIGGWQWRRSGADNVDSETVSGPTVGVGLELNLGVSLFLEGTMEMNDELTGFPGAEDIDVNPLVIQAGVMFGG